MKRLSFRKRNIMSFGCYSCSKVDIIFFSELVYICMSDLEERKGRFKYSNFIIIVCLNREYGLWL